MVTPEAQIKIFISYRRSGEIGFVGRLTDRLSSVYGEKNVFRDISGLRSGEEFEKRIGSKLSEATVVIAVIGTNWVGRRPFRKARILTDGDWVRKELEHALASETPVIPILVGDAVLPTRNKLPASLKGLLSVHTGRIRDESWENDSSELIRAIDAVASGRHTQDGEICFVWRRVEADEPSRLWLVISAALVCILVGFFYLAKHWQAGWSTEHVLLKLRSYVMSIHREPKMVDVKQGSFRMGDISDKGDEKSQQPVHEVRLLKPFRIGKYEVTFDEYDRFAIEQGKPLPDDAKSGRGPRPVINVSWKDARDYAEWLSKQTGKRYRLPSESEWEFAARSGGKNEHWAGTSDEKKLAEYAVTGNSTEPVGSRKPNGLGLYDMSGNVFEWVEDCWHPNYNGAPSDGRPWKEENGGDCGQRVLRGGYWASVPSGLRASWRWWFDGSREAFTDGFRLAEDVP